MSVVLTFDLKGAESQEYQQIQSFFERLGWQNLGGSSYRYPRLGSGHPVEDWFNHVVPALMLFRSYVSKTGREVTKFTLDAHSSSGFDKESEYGHAPADDSMELYNPNTQQFGEKKLREWLGEVQWPYS